MSGLLTSYPLISKPCGFSDSHTNIEIDFLCSRSKIFNIFLKFFKHLKREKTVRVRLYKHVLNLKYATFENNILKMC